MSRKLPNNAGAILQGPLQEVGRPILYMPALLIVAALMLLLPLAYLALIGAAGYGVYWHAVTNHAWMSSGAAGRTGFLVPAGYLLPIIAGVVVILFMIKPFFAPRAEKLDVLSLEEAEQPYLFAYIRSLCEEVGAPVPRRIDVDCDVNASAGPAAGLFSLLRRDLVLTLGLPLVMGLDVRQLSGVIAHEFGHFTQGVGMVASYAVNSINRWFARVVYERDAWDAWLEQAQSHSNNLLVSIVVGLIRLLVWTTRRVLWVFMVVGHMLSCFLARQMEYDADRIQAHVSGSAAFKATAHRIISLDAAFHASHRELNERFGEGRLPDNLPMLIASNSNRFKKEIAEQVQSELEGRSGSLFDTHPPMRKRIEHAERESVPGIVGVDAPASALFRDADDVCERATWEHYKVVLGDEFYETELVSTRKLLADTSEADRAERVIGQFIPAPMVERFAFWLEGTIHRPDDAKALLGELKSARERYAANQARARELAETFDEARGAVIKATVACTLVRAGLRVDTDEYTLEKATKAHADAARHFAEDRVKEVRGQLKPFEELANTRIMAALGLLYVKQIAGRVGDGRALRADANTMLRVLGALAGVRPSILSLSSALVALEELLKAAQAARVNETMHHAALGLTRRMTKAMSAVRGATHSVDYPFDHAKERVTVADFLCPSVPNPDDVVAVYECAAEMISRTMSVYSRATGRIAATAQRVEQVLDMQPIAEPAPAGS